jgi:hypothetical protein
MRSFTDSEISREPYCERPLASDTASSVLGKNIGYPFREMKTFAAEDRENVKLTAVA